MLYYLYDGSFEGLLTAIYEAYYRRQKPDGIVVSGNTQQSLFDSNVYIETDSEKADRVYDSIRNKISPDALENAYYVFLSEVEGAGTLIYNYLSLGWKLGSDVDLNLSDDRVLQVMGIRRKVGGERHRMLGLLRFKLIGENLYYAPMEPLYNITGLIAPHFADRLSDQNWIIHDIGRNLAAVYNTNNWVITDLNAGEYAHTGKTEEAYQMLWKRYFKTIAIQNRINPKLQKSHMPMRYWRYLIEKQ